MFGLYGGPKIYAIIETGGKQYRITEGQTVDVARLGVDEGSTIELERVLLIGDGSEITAGRPLIEGARVMATAQQNGRDGKIIVFKYKPKVRYRRKLGHRQNFTRLLIDKILPPGAAAPAKKTTRRRKKEETAEETPADGA